MESRSQFTLSGELGLRRDDLDQQTVTPERRAKPRIQRPFPTRAFGTDGRGERFEVDCELDNISSRGVFVRISRELTTGSEINVIVRFVKSEESGTTAILNCEVLRNEPQADGRHGIAM